MNRADTKRKHRGYTPEQKANALALLKDGATRSQVSQTLNISFHMIKRWSSETSEKSREHPNDKRLEGLRLIDEGMAQSEVSELLGISESTIAYWRKIGAEHLLQREKEKTSREERRRQIIDEMQSGKTDKQLANKFSLSRSAINTIRRELMGNKRDLVAYSETQKRRAIDLVAAGKTLSDAARTIGCKPATVRMWFAKALENGAAVWPEKPKSAIEDKAFLWITRDYPQYAEWQGYAAEWLRGEKKALGLKIEAISTFIRRYLVAQKLPASPEFLLRRGVVLPDFFETVCPQSSCGISWNNNIHQFLNWVLLHNFSERADNGHPFISPAFCNPIPKLTSGGLPTKFESGYEPLPYGYVDQLRRKLAQGPNFRDWVWAQNALGRKRKLEEFEDETINDCATEWFEVPEQMIDKDDPDCVWIFTKPIDKRTPATFKMWSPVRWVALLLKLQVPARTFQVRFLDSGESDTWEYENQKWQRNTQHLATGTAKRPWQNGVLRRVQSVNGTESTTLYFNTNKTKDQWKSGADKGYECPWPILSEIESQPHYWLEKLRNWQKKYNPISRRTAWSEVPATIIGTAKSDLQLASYTDACFLFRTAEFRKQGREQLPIPDGAIAGAWYALLSSLEKDFAKEGFTHADGSPIVFVKSQNSKTGTYFPLHCLRVSLITALAIDGGMSADLLMKVVGHSRLVMTLYYTKRSLSHIQDALHDAAERIDAQKEKSIISFLTNSDRTQLLDQAVFNSTDGAAFLVEENPDNRNPAGWLPLHHGVCLAGGNTNEVEGNFKVRGCHNGGQEIPGSNGRFGPVPGGVRNCVRCRWFVTEPHFVPALAAHLGNLLYHMDEARATSVNYEAEWTAIKKQKADSETAGLPFADMAKLKTAERLLESSMARFSNLAADMAACWRLIERCNVVASSITDAGTTALIATDDAMSVHAIVEETDSELLQLAGVCQNVEIYPDLESGKAVFRRSQLLDAALSNESIPSFFMVLSESEQLKYGNLFMRKLAQRTNSENLMLGIRRVCALMDAGRSIADLMGVDVAEFLLHEQPDAQNFTLKLTKDDCNAENEYSS